MMRLLGVRVKGCVSSFHGELKEFVQIANPRVAHQYKVYQVLFLVETFGYFSENQIIQRSISTDLFAQSRNALLHGVWHKRYHSASPSKSYPTQQMDKPRIYAQL